MSNVPTRKLQTGDKNSRSFNKYMAQTMLKMSNTSDLKRSTVQTKRNVNGETARDVDCRLPGISTNQRPR